MVLDGSRFVTYWSLTIMVTFHALSVQRLC